MPSFESPALYIDFARLPPPQVIEEIDYEVLLKRYQDDVVAKNSKLAAAIALEQSPTNIILESEAYGEMIVRKRINAAARACMLPFANGSDLEVIGARFNVARMDGEDDTRLRRRIQLSMESFTTAGSTGAYIFHALSVSTAIRDASVVAERGTGRVSVTIMADGANPVPPSSLVDAVYDRLMSDGIKPLTDDIAVLPVVKIPADIEGRITLYPGPDASLVVADINKALQSLRTRVSMIGRDLKRSAILAALNQEGVQNVELDFDDINVGPDSVVWIESASVSISSFREE
ncbi:phage-related baseplate assembly protein [Bradyrhizobium diazoefficiens]